MDNQANVHKVIDPQLEAKLKELFEGKLHIVIVRTQGPPAIRIEAFDNCSSPMETAGLLTSALVSVIRYDTANGPAMVDLVCQHLRAALPVRS